MVILKDSVLKLFIEYVSGKKNHSNYCGDLQFWIRSNFSKTGAVYRK